MFVDIFFQSLALIIAFIIVGQLVARLIAPTSKENDNG